MTPKEKAIDLIDKFYNSENCHKKHFPNPRYCDCSEMNMFQAKQCAIICVEEIQKEVSEFRTTMRFKGCVLSDAGYWIEVKSELEKL